MKIVPLRFLMALVLAATSVTPSVGQACTSDGKEGIFPENTLYIPDHPSLISHVTEAEFNESIVRAEKIYAPVFAAQGRVLKVVNKWKDGTVNAYAKRKGNVSEVHMFGGLARHTKMSRDGFELVICHETGHHLGGAPKVKLLIPIHKWGSNEGQSDYFATLKCSREMWKSDNNEAILALMEIPATVTERCQKGFDKTLDIQICKRAAMAGKALGDTLADMNKLPMTDFDTPDTKVVSRMTHTHPKAQCRLDTYFAGAVCPVAKEDPLSDTDATVGTCSEESGDTLGIRPRCWYKASEKGGKTPKSSWPKLSRN